MNTRKGFTLVELLAVIVIIIIVVSVMIGGAGYMQRKAGTARTMTDMESIKMALEEFKTEFGAYPVLWSPDAVNALTKANITNINGAVVFTTTYPVSVANKSGISTTVYHRRAYLPTCNGKDCFGQPYNYRGPGNGMLVNKDRFDLWSSGANRKDEGGGGDDIRNW